MIACIEIDVPVRIAYDLWTQHKKFPLFMDQVSSVREVAPGVLRWRARTGDLEREWETEITDLQPDQRVTWTATGPSGPSGEVTFQHRDDSGCVVALELTARDDGSFDLVAPSSGSIENGAAAVLRRFKEYAEASPTDLAAIHEASDQRHALESELANMDRHQS